jgi:catechol 2,3-dioxygenase-like lactoylglutathione lyase family enzyme
VSDPERSAELYAQLGFELRGLEREESAEPHLLVSFAGLMVKLVAEGSGRVGGCGVEVTVDDVRAKHEALDRAGLRPGPLADRPQGDRCFDWRDPDGHRFRFIGPRRDAVPTASHRVEGD